MAYGASTTRGLGRYQTNPIVHNLATDDPRNGYSTDGSNRDKIGNLNTDLSGDNTPTGSGPSNPVTKSSAPTPGSTDSTNVTQNGKTTTSPYSAAGSFLGNMGYASNPTSTSDYGLGTSKLNPNEMADLSSAKNMLAFANANGAPNARLGQMNAGAGAHDSDPTYELYNMPGYQDPSVNGPKGQTPGSFSTPGIKNGGVNVGLLANEMNQNYNNPASALTLVNGVPVNNAPGWYNQMMQAAYQNYTPPGSQNGYAIAQNLPGGGH